MFATVLGDMEDAVGRLFESRSGCGWKLNKKMYRENGDLCSEIAIRALSLPNLVNQVVNRGVQVVNRTYLTLPKS